MNAVVAVLVAVYVACLVATLPDPAYRRLHQVAAFAGGAVLLWGGVWFGVTAVIS